MAEMQNERLTPRLLPPPTIDRLKRPSLVPILVLAVAALLGPLFLSYYVITYEPLVALMCLLPFALAMLLVVPARPTAHPGRYTFPFVCLTLALWPLWPAYGGIGLPGMPVLGASRTLLYLLIVISAWQYATTLNLRQDFARVMNANRLFFYLLLALFLVFLASIPMARRWNDSFYEYSNRILFWLAPLLIVCVFATTRKRIETLISVLIASVTILAVVVAIEYVQRDNIVVRYWPRFLTITADWAAAAQELKFRGIDYRAQGPFNHPLSMAEFCAVSLPLVFYRMLRARNMVWLAGYAAIAGVVAFAIHAADSRGSLVASMMAFACFAGMLLIRFQKFHERSQLRVLVALVLVSGIVVAMPIMGYSIHKMAAGTTAKTVGSSQARVAQIEKAIPKVMARPLLGYGVGFAVEILDYRAWDKLTIDCYYINLVLDAGLPGLVLYIALFGVLCWKLLARAYARDGPDAYLFIACAASILAYLTSRSVLSVGTNILTVMAIAGIGLVALCLDEEQNGPAPRLFAR